MGAASAKGAISIDERRDRPEVTHFEVLQLLLMLWPTMVGLGVPDVTLRSSGAVV